VGSGMPPDSAEGAVMGLRAALGAVGCGELGRRRLLVLPTVGGGGGGPPGFLVDLDLDLDFRLMPLGADLPPVAPKPGICVCWFWRNGRVGSPEGVELSSLALTALFCRSGLVPPKGPAAGLSMGKGSGRSSGNVHVGATARR
jgi:hypothetical protein